MATHISRSPEQTEQFGKVLASTLTPGDVVGLIGDLGAGKTQFVRGLAQGLGFKGRIHSPTFTLVNQYETARGPLFHLDLYRLENSRQILAAGLDQYLFDQTAITLIEWFDRWTPDLPQPSRTKIVRINLLNDHERELTYETFGS